MAVKIKNKPNKNKYIITGAKRKKERTNERKKETKKERNFACQFKSHNHRSVL